ncbi:MAG: hypothetical protein PHN31_02220 [Candidatus Gracilibacteria bacterium]|nr:hypothetical protein [Candidatus Gracilibacteria bacterium]
MSNNIEMVVESKVCRHCQTKFEITDKDLEFYEKVSPSIGGKKHVIPSPTLCPECRQQRRLAFRNERKLYKRTCDATGKPIISMFSPDKKIKVYNKEDWWSDKWNPMDEGKEFDFNKTFFEQFKELYNLIPQVALVAIGNENCDYTNFAGYNKSCYLCYDYGWNNDCSYITKSYRNSNSIDMFSSLECENSYGLTDCYKCNNCTNCINTENSSDCNYCFNCSGCNSCILCSNLSNKSYYILNKQYTKEDYYKKKKELDLLNSSDFKKEFNNLLTSSIHKFSNNLSCENVLGDYLKECSNAYYSFNSQKSKNIKYVNDAIIVENSYDDLFSGNNTSMTLETIGCENLNNSCFCYSCWQGNHNIYYSYFCHASSNLFGCVGIRNKDYCILNKQYTKDEYEELVPKIIEHMQKTGEWGEFFPSSISPFGYNETLANEYFPLSREKVLSIVIPAKAGIHRQDNSLLNKKASAKNNFNDLGINLEGQNTFINGPIFNRSTYEQPIPKVDKIIPASKVPKDIKEIPDDILNRAIECEITKKPFRIISQELDFYRKHNLPIPRRHPDQRHLDRMALRNPRKLYDRQCDKCVKDIKTTYAPERSEIVYCENCYNKEIY